MTTNDYETCDYLHSGLIRACYMCHPGDAILAAYPQWRNLGLEVSHGLCSAHREQLTANIMKMKAQRAALKLAA